jgi:signal transduction histidine kinase
MKHSKIAQMGIVKVLSEIKTPLTNIKLCLDLLQKDAVVENQHVYFEILKKSTSAIETAVEDLCNSFSDLGIAIHIPADKNHLDSMGDE